MSKKNEKESAVLLALTGISLAVYSFDVLYSKLQLRKQTKILQGIKEEIIRGNHPPVHPPFPPFPPKHACHCNHHSGYHKHDSHCGCKKNQKRDCPKHS